MSGPVEGLRGLGPTTARRLAEVGIHSSDALRAAGAVAAFRVLRFRFGRAVTLNALYGLDAAIRNIDWREIDAAAKPNCAAKPASTRENVYTI